MSVQTCIDKVTLWFRVFIIVALITAAMVVLCSFTNTFWPPDMVPHPHLPDDPVKKDQPV